MNIDVLTNSFNSLTSHTFESEVNTDRGFWAYYTNADLLRMAGNQHSWTRATTISMGRAAVGSGLSFVRHPVFGKNINKSRQKEIDRIMDDVNQCFFGAPKSIDYIQDTLSSSAKIYYTVNSFVLYGQACWEKIRDKDGKMIGFDALSGLVMPNVDVTGKFLNPAYLYRPWNSQITVSYAKDELVYFASPGIDLSIFGSSDYSALSNHTIPSDVYASKAYKLQFENINAPYNGVWVVDPSTSEEDYADFLALLANRYTGIETFGSNPLVIRGMAKFEEHRSRSNDDAPYLEGRRYNQEEISAVTGISSAKLGITDNASKTNHRELRREFHENTLRPIFAFIEEAIYNQVLVHEFGLTEFRLAFNRPDLSTALEEATIVGRYVQNGIYSPNEAREIVGRSAREDEYGDKYIIPSGGAWTGSDNIISVPQRNIVTPTTAEIVTPKESVPIPPEVRIQDGGSNRVNDMVRPPASDDNYTDTRKSEFYVGELKKWLINPRYKYDGNDRYLAEIQSIIDTISPDHIDDIKLFVNNVYEELT